MRLALAHGDAEAGQQLADIVVKYPKWSDGYRELAAYQWNHQQPDQALASAQKALEFNPNEAPAAAIAIQALAAAKRTNEAFALADRFATARDAQVPYQAAAAAYGIGDNERSARYLSSAMARAKGAVPATFHFLSARLALRHPEPDLAGAEASLMRAVATDPKLLDADYELGRVHLFEAERDPLTARKHYEKAEEAFTIVVRALPDDYESWLGLGQAQLRLGALITENEDREVGERHLKDAQVSLGHALNANDQLMGAHLALGETQVRLTKYQEALPHLEKAKALGASGEALDQNLALALQNSGRADEAATLLSANAPDTGGEAINKGMVCYKAGSYASAAELLQRAADSKDLEKDDALRAQALCYAGHALRRQAEKLAADATQREAREVLLDRAGDVYRSAGDRGSNLARRHFLALQAGRDAVRAYAAGWTYLSWQQYIAPRGWGVVIGNYGGTGVWRQPVHLGVWGVAIAIPLLAWLASLFRRPHRPRRRVEPTPSRQRRSSRAETADESPDEPRQPARRATPALQPKRAGSRSSGRRRSDTDEIQHPDPPQRPSRG